MALSRLEVLQYFLLQLSPDTLWLLLQQKEVLLFKSTSLTRVGLAE